MYSSGFVAVAARGYGASVSNSMRKPCPVPLFGSSVVCSLSVTPDEGAPLCSTTNLATASPCQTQTTSMGQRLSDSTASNVIRVPSTMMVLPTRMWMESATSDCEYTTGSVVVGFDEQAAMTRLAAIKTKARIPFLFSAGVPDVPGLTRTTGDPL